MRFEERNWRPGIACLLLLHFGHFLLILQWAYVDKLFGIFYYLSEMSLEESYKDNFANVSSCLRNSSLCNESQERALCTVNHFIPARGVENAGGCQNGHRKEAKKNSFVVRNFDY